MSRSLDPSGAEDALIPAARLDLASKLLELGADPNAGTREAETVRGYRTVLGAAAGRARSAAVVRLLLAAGADPADGPTLYEGCAMWEAVRRRDAGLTLPMLAALARGGARLDETYALLVKLFAAQQAGDAASTEAAVDASPEVAGRALVESVTLGAIAVMRALLDAGVDIDSRRSDGTTALHQAAFEGNAELVEELLARGADLSLRDAVYDGAPAGWAEAGGHEDLAKRLAARSG